MSGRLNRKLLVLILIILVGSALAVLAVHRGGQESADGKLPVAATFYPLYDFAQQVGGSKIQAVNITPAGAEPHDYEPSPRQLIGARQSAVFIYGGGNLEPWVGKFLADYSNFAINAGRSAVAPGQIAKDPHFWLDPVLAQKAVDSISAGLIHAEPNDASYFKTRARGYSAKLTQLNKDFKAGLNSCQTRTFVTSHAAFGYMAKRYNLNMVAIAGVSPDEEPGADKLAKLSRLVKENHIKYIFFEKLTSPRLAQTIARETGAKTAVLNPIEGVTNAEQKAGKNYLSIQRENLAALRIALACR